MMQSNNFIVIQGWMRTELNLKGNDLIVYAIIYGFSQTQNQKFTGSLQYIADWCGATKQGVLKNLKNLLDKHLIEKTEHHINGVNSVEYHTTQLNTPLNSVEHPIKLSLINNIDNKTENKILSKDKNTFDFGKTKQPKQTLYSKCVNHIYSFSTNLEVQKYLLQFLSAISEMQKLRGEKQFIGILNKLKEITESSKEQVQVIQYSIEHGYATFYDCRNRKSYGKTGNVAVDIEGLDPTQMRRATAEEKRKFKEDIANGKAEKF